MDLSVGEKHDDADGFSLLPREIVFAILLHLPASFLWEVARRVCRSWHNIINDPAFIDAHLAKSEEEGSLLVKEFDTPERTYYLENDGTSFEPILLEGRFRFPGLPGNSCNGLCIFLGIHSRPYNFPVHPLMDNLRKLRTLYVANPLTNQIQRLPSMRGGSVKCFLLTYIEQTSVYKALCAFTYGLTSYLLTFTLGDDVNWRRVTCVPERILKGISNLSSVSIREFLYVIQGDTTILSVNLLEETTEYIHFPRGRILKSYGLQVKGDRLSCMVYHNDYLSVWMRNGTEWNEYCKIYNTRARSELRYGYWTPVGWLDNTLILTEINCRFFWLYDADTGTMKVWTTNRSFCWRLAIIHKKSLVKW